MDATYFQAFNPQQHLLTNPLGSYAMLRKVLKPARTAVGKCQVILQPGYAIIQPDPPGKDWVLPLEGIDCGRGRNMEDIEGVQRPSILSLRKEKTEFLFAPQSGRTDEAREIALSFARAISNKRPPLASSTTSLNASTTSVARPRQDRKSVV